MCLPPEPRSVHAGRVREGLRLLWVAAFIREAARGETLSVQNARSLVGICSACKTVKLPVWKYTDLLTTCTAVLGWRLFMGMGDDVTPHSLPELPASTAAQPPQDSRLPEAPRLLDEIQLPHGGPLLPKAAQLPKVPQLPKAELTLVRAANAMMPKAILPWCPVLC